MMDNSLYFWPRHISSKVLPMCSTPIREKLDAWRRIIGGLCDSVTTICCGARAPILTLNTSRILTLSTSRRRWTRSWEQCDSSSLLPTLGSQFWGRCWTGSNKKRWQQEERGRRWTPQVRFLYKGWQANSTSVNSSAPTCLGSSS